ncbi:MAG: methyl-accepting chemotaxis protein [Eubacteriales bacterium]|nr:methyl-accepting chemotaxis protein [Bacillota bacterium]MBV1726966.1 methyl-accepting chemotaxis protein [Desulforudis sp.]MDQ7788785.1 methyl-accepting chemotaxis protein [Clostridia bacterium]MDZ4044025.1 methyl-accepting chemotaxis protein [Eubacteriales bacterium]MBU4534010.1 methyl-accepting chemotaxis protein [Bacillota bacterium]
MSIRQKIITGYLVTFFFFVITGLVGLTAMSSMQRSYEQLIERRVSLVHETQQMLLSFEYEALMARTFYLTGQEEWEAEYRKQALRTEQTLRSIESQLISQEERALFAHLSRSVLNFVTDYAEPLIAVRKQEDLSESERISRIIEATIAQKGTVRGIIRLGEDFVDYQRDLMTQSVQQNAEWITRIQIITSAMAALCLILGLGLAWYLSRTIVEPVWRLEEAAARVGRGDLSGSDLNLESRDEMGRLSRSFSTMVGDLRLLTGRISNTSQQVARLTGEIRTNSELAADAASQTANVLVKTTGKIQLMVGVAREVAATSDKARQRAHQVEEMATSFLSQMEKSRLLTVRAGSALRELENKLESVDQVNEFVKALAEQAALLARRAATEVAFADGGQIADKSQDGTRNFVALAGEMHNRAKDAVEATRNVSGLIDSVQEHAREAVTLMDEDFKIISSGHQLATETGEAFRDIIIQVQTLARQMQEAAVLSEQIAQSLGKISLHTEEQSNLSAQAAVATETLNRLVSELDQAIGAFRS